MENQIIPPDALEREALNRKYSNAVLRVLPLSDGSWAIFGPDCQLLRIGGWPSELEARELSNHQHHSHTRPLHLPRQLINAEDLGL